MTSSVENVVKRAFQIKLVLVMFIFTRTMYDVSEFRGANRYVSKSDFEVLRLMFQNRIWRYQHVCFKIGFYGQSDLAEKSDFTANPI